MSFFITGLNGRYRTQFSGSYTTKRDAFDTTRAPMTQVIEIWPEDGPAQSHRDRCCRIDISSRHHL